MEITLTASQFSQLQRIPANVPLDTCDGEMDLRNLPKYLAAVEEIIGTEALNNALATGEPIQIRVDWSR